MEAEQFVADAAGNAFEHFVSTAVGMDTSIPAEFGNFSEEAQLQAMVNLMSAPDETSAQSVQQMLTPQTTLRLLESLNAMPQPTETVIKAEPGMALCAQYCGPADAQPALETSTRSLASTLPMSAFFPLGKSDCVPETVVCTPGYVLEVLRQPPPEVTKAVYVELHIQLRDISQLIMSEFKPLAALVYEDGSLVIPNSGHDVLEGLQTIRDGICVLKVRVNELSKAHRNQRFKVRIVASGAFGQAVCYTTPMRVLSKTSIIMQHRQALEPEEAKRIQPSASILAAQARKRTRDDCEQVPPHALTPISSATAATAASPLPDQKRVELSTEVGELRKLVLQNTLAVTSFRAQTTQQLDELRGSVRQIEERLATMTELLQQLAGRQS